MLDMPESLPATNECPRCKGRGWILQADGTAGTAVRCDCQVEDHSPRLLAGARIPARYASCSLKSFDINAPSPGSKSQLLQAKTLSQRYVDTFIDEKGAFTETGLIFIGPPGVGKTHLAVAVLRELIGRYRVRGLFVDFTTLIHDIQATFDPDSPDSKRALLDPVIEAEVLILDELGAQKPSPWVNEILYLVMNSRYTKRVPTLFTTNYRLESSAASSSGNLDRTPAPAGYASLENRITPNLMSRLYEMARPVEIEVEDFRREVQMQKHRI
jgi:DNA replication protein DnaC